MLNCIECKFSAKFSLTTGAQVMILMTPEK